MYFKENNSIILVSFALIQKAEEIGENIKRSFREFALITLAPNDSRSNLSWCQLYIENSLKENFKLPTFKFGMRKAVPLLFLYLDCIVDLFSIYYALHKMKRKFEIYIGMGFFLTSIGLLLRKFRIVKKVIYCSGDYYIIPKQWGIKNWYQYLQIKIFHMIDRLNTRCSDAIWNTSLTMPEARRKAGIIVPDDIPQIYFPLGIKVNKNVIKMKKYDSKEIAFIGHLKKDQGIELFLEILPEVSGIIPDIKLNIIGAGEYGEKLKEMVQFKNLERCVKFYGFIGSSNILDEIFSRCAIGIALYKPGEQSFTQYASPGKIFKYLSNGLPVITTCITEISKEIKDFGAGIVIDYSKDALKEAIFKILSDKDFLKTCTKNAQRLSLEYSWDRLLDEVFSKTFESWNLK